MEAFGNFQEGFLGDFITGKDGNNYQNHFYLDWYSDANGRVVYEGSSDEVKIIEPLVFIPRDQRKTQNYIAQIFLKYFPENSVARKILDGATNTDLL